MILNLLLILFDVPPNIYDYIELYCIGVYKENNIDIDRKKEEGFYHPLFANCSLSGSLSRLMPTIASPNPDDTWHNTAASS
jgi:hypothetical protein